MQIDPKIIHEEPVTTLRPSVRSYTTVTGWATCFREGKEDVNDYPPSVSSLFQLTWENIELVRQVISNDSH